MTLSADQRGIVINGGVALALTIAALVTGYVLIPPGALGLEADMGVAERLAYVLKWDLLILLWLAGCVRVVSSGRFNSVADIRGSAFSPPSTAIAVKSAVLQNSLEQSVLAIGVHLALATLLAGAELRLVPLLVAVYLFGRVTFALGYAKGPAARAFGMTVTGGALIAAFFVAFAAIASGR